MMELSVTAEGHGANAVTGKRQRARRAQQELQIRQDIAAFRERMQRLADILATWLEGSEIGITLREMVHGTPAGAYTLPAIVLRHGRNWAGFMPQALYSATGGIQFKGEVTLAVDNPRRHPRTEKYMLCMQGHRLSTSGWVIYGGGHTPGKGKVLTRELLLAAIAPLFDGAV